MNKEVALQTGHCMLYGGDFLIKDNATAVECEQGKEAWISLTVFEFEGEQRNDPFRGNVTYEQCTFINCNNPPPKEQQIDCVFLDKRP